MINPASPAGETISFINRDHIISVTIRERHIVVTTTDGKTTDFPISDDATLASFADDLANAVQSNFVSIAAEPRVIG